MPSSELQPAGLREILEAISGGKPLARRLIVGTDLEKALSSFVRPDATCADGPRLRIENSVIQGELSLQGTKTDDRASASDDDVPEQPKKALASWVAIPVAIQDTTLDGYVTVKNVGFACPVGLERSKFEDRFSADSVRFSADFDAAGTTFSQSFSAIGVEWENAVVFKAASFMAHVEFVRRNFPSRFGGTTDFQEAVFNRDVTLVGSDFAGHTDFSYARFLGTASFSATNIGAGPAKRFAGPFYMAEFNDQANFRNTRVKSLRFYKTMFKQGIDLHGSSGGNLQFWGTTLAGRANFSDIDLEKLELNGFNTFTTVEGDIIIRRSKIGDLSFVRAILKRNVDLEEATILSGLSFQTVSFEGSVHLEDAVLPPEPATGTDAARQPRLLLRMSP